MNKPASAPDVIAPQPPPDEPASAGDGDGTNAVQHEVDPQADVIPGSGEHKYRPSTPYTRKV